MNSKTKDRLLLFTGWLLVLTLQLMLVAFLSEPASAAEVQRAWLKVGAMYINVSLLALIIREFR